MPRIRVNRALPPAFDELPPGNFELMTCALAGWEPDIRSASLYKTPRQRQFGVDVVAETNDGCLEVLSCKKYSELDKGDLKNFSDEFLDHWDQHWRSRRVRRFVLAVTVNVHSEQRASEVEAERKRFTAIGVRYDVWAPHQLQEKLRPHPGIVSQMIGPEHVPIICGVIASTMAVPAPGRAVPDSGPSAEALDELRQAISAQVGHRLDYLLSGFRSGRVADTVTALAGIRTGPEWNALDNAAKARVLRLQASTRIHANDEAGASALADEADRLDPGSEPRLRALLAYRRDGPAAALQVLGEPTSQQGVHLKAALLLEAGDIRAGLQLLDAHPAVETGHAETLRLRALGALQSGDREQGLVHAEMAIAAQPAWLSVQWAAAIAQYACALSPIVRPDRFLAPNPVPLDLVKEDERSHQLLLKAMNAFEALSTSAEATPDERRDSAVFALACLCNLRERSTDAAARVGELLHDDPAWAAVANWALARGFPIDTAALRAALEEKLESGGGRAEHVLLLAMVLDMEGRAAETAVAVERWGSAFGTSESDRAFHQDWLARFRRRAGGTETTVPANGAVDVDDLEDLLAAAKTSGDWSVLEGLFERLASETSPPPMTILPIAQVLAASGRWTVLGRHTDTLAAVGTPDPIRIVAHALLNTGRAQPMLNLLRDCRSAFPGSKLPADLARIEVEALSRVGNQAAAIRIAVSLASTDGAGGRDALAAAAAHLRVGNVHGALPYVRAAEAQEDLRPREALSLAQAVATADPATAARLWRRAQAGGAEPSLVPAALDLAFRLKLENEAAPLMGMLGDLSSVPGSGISAISIDEIIQFMRERNDASEKISQMHLRGELPVHLAAEHAGASLVDLYQLGGTSQSGRGNYPIMMMHGLRSSEVAKPWQPGDGPVHMDVTAVLVAEQLGLFDVLETMKGQVFLPPSLPAALLDMEQRLRHHQPRRLDGMRHVLALAASGRIVRSHADAEPGLSKPGTSAQETWTVEFTRELGKEIVAEPADRPVPRGVNLRGVVDALLSMGEIDPASHLAAVTELGTEGRVAAIGSPARGDHLAAPQLLAVELAQAGVLEQVVDTFTTSVTSQDFDQLSAEMARVEDRQSKASWIAALRARIALALGDGTFLTLPESAHDDEEERVGAGSRCLGELLRASGAAGGVTWIDDRLANGFVTCGANRIFSTPEMLDALLKAGRITASTRWSNLLTLRANRALFIPLRAEEVLHYLLPAPRTDRRVVETPSLATLRVYVAAVLLNAQHLVVAPVREGTGSGELPVLLALRRLAEETVLAVWIAEGRDDVDRALMSAWAWSSLRVDRLPDLGLPGTSPNAWRHICALQFAGLLANGLQILTQVPSAHRTQRLASYYRWVEEAVPDWLWDDEALVESVGTFLARLWGGLFENGPDEPEAWPAEARQHVQALIGHAVARVPDGFRASLLADSSFCRVAGIRTRSVIGLAGRQFERDPLLAAAASALRGKKATVPTADGKSVLTLHRRSGPAPRLRLSGALNGTFDDPLIGLASTSRSIRIEAANAIVGALGLTAASATRAVAQLVEPRSAGERLDVALQLRQESRSWWLKDLMERLPKPSDVKSTDFEVGEPRPLLKHLGLQMGEAGTLGARIPNAAAILLTDFGAAETIRRLSALPVPLPENIVAEAISLSEDERGLLLDELGGVNATPLQMLHGIRLRRAVAEHDAAGADAYQAALETLALSWERVTALFIVLLRQFGEALRTGSCGSVVLRPDEAIAIAWAHSDHLARALIASGRDLARARSWFGKRPIGGDLGRAVALTPRFDRAPAAPTSMMAEVLLFHGLGYALGNEKPSGALAVADSVMQQICALLSVGEGPDRTPSPWLFVDRGQGDDDLGSWFQMRPSWIFDAPFDLSGPGARSAISAGLAELGAGQAQNSATWMMMGFASRAALDADSMSLASKALASADFPPMVVADQSLGLAAMNMAVDLAHASESAIAVEQLEEQLIAVVRRLAALHPGRVERTGPARDALLDVIEIASRVARSSARSDGWRRFGINVVRVAEAWPGAVALLRDVVGSLASAVHPEHAEALSSTWHRLRAIR